MITKVSEEDPRGGNRYWKVITPPAVEPLTADEVKLFARIDGTSEDTLIDGFIKGVREAAEAYLGRALIAQTIRLVLDEWPGTVVELPRPPLLTVTKVVTVDEDDTETTYDADNYFIDTNSEPGRVVIRNGASVPDNTERYTSGYWIEYTAGYGAAEDVPQQILEGLKLWVTAVYENRAISTEPAPQARHLLDVYKVVKL